MKKKFLLLFLVLMSTALAMNGQSINRCHVWLNGVYNNTYYGINTFVTTNPAIFNAGDEVELVFTPPTGYILDDVYVNSGGTPTIYIRNGFYFVKANATYFSEVYVNFVSSSGGTANPINVSQLIRHGSVFPQTNLAQPGRRVSLHVYPDPDYETRTVTAKVFSDFFYRRPATTIEPTSPGSNTYRFTMPDRPVEVFANFKPTPPYVPPYTFRVAKPHDGIWSTDVVINGIRRVRNRYDSYFNYYDNIDCNDYIEVTNFPNTGYWTTYVWADGYNGGTYQNNWLYTNTFTFDMPCCDVELDYETYYGPYKVNIIPSANGRMKTYNDWYYSDAGEPVYLEEDKQYHQPGYQLVPNSVEYSRTPVGPWQQCSQTSNGYYYYFTMPNSDAYVHSTFQKKTYTITLEPNSNGILQAKNYTTNFSATNNMYPYNTLNAQIGDEIKLSHAILAGSGLEFAYYIIKKTSDGSVIGVTNSDFRRFTMPPCDLTISAYIAPPPVMEVVLTPLQFAHSEPFINTIGEVIGIIYLHERTDLEDPSKSRSFTGLDDEENYGWSTAVPGEPMYFTVVPEAGYQVKKSDINVKLLAVSENEDGEVVVLEDCVVQEGFDISGPDDYVTEPTDFSFIFDVPEGYNPSTVQVAFDATFTPVDYNITVNPGIEHGTIMAPATARMDDLVTFTVVPEPGCRLTGITITSETSGLFQAVADENNQFTMPACDVLVSAEFEESSVLRGDVDNDGFVNISDVTVLIDYILSGDESMVSLEGADCDLDGIVNISDLTLLIDYILSGIW